MTTPLSTTPVSPSPLDDETGSPEGRESPRRDQVRDRILDVAERMFASQSFAGVSIRNVTAEAGVNLAAVNYYFGSKAGLLKAVFLRRATDLNRERLGQLQAYVAAADAARGPESALELEPILRALLGPAVRWLFEPERGLKVFIHFLARCQMEEEPELKTLFYQDVDHLRRFVPALKRALPGMPDSEIYWCMHYALGTMHYTFTHLERLKMISRGSCDITDPDQVIDRMIEFCKAGFDAALARVAG